MITFKQYLLEAVVQPWKTEHLTISIARKIAQANCKEALAAAKQSKFLFRAFTDTRGFGTAHDEPCMLLDSTGSHRTSADTNNFYQAMIDVHPHLVSIPSRSNSIICGTHIDIALSYNDNKNNVYLVLPFDSVRNIAISSGSDFLGTSLPSNIFRQSSRALDLFAVGPKMEHILSNLHLDHKLFANDLEDAEHTLLNINPLHLFFELDVNFSGTGILLKQGGTFNEVYQVWKKSGQKKIEKLSEDDLTTVGKKLLKLFKQNPVQALSLYIFGDMPNIAELGTMMDLKNRVEAWFTGKAILVNVNSLDEFSKDLFEIKV